MPYMANDNQNQVLDEQTEVIDDQKSTKRVRKTKPKASEGGTTASLFGIEPYQPKKMKNTCLKDSLSISAKF
jgi:DnaK suppressor protein